MFHIFLFHFFLFHFFLVPFIPVPFFLLPFFPTFVWNTNYSSGSRWKTILSSLFFSSWNWFAVSFLSYYKVFTSVFVPDQDEWLASHNENASKPRWNYKMVGLPSIAGQPILLNFFSVYFYGWNLGSKPLIFYLKFARGLENGLAFLLTPFVALGQFTPLIKKKSNKNTCPRSPKANICSYI